MEEKRINPMDQPPPPVKRKRGRPKKHRSSLLLTIRNRKRQSRLFGRTTYRYQFRTKASRVTTPVWYRS